MVDAATLPSRSRNEVWQYWPIAAMAFIALVLTLLRLSDRLPVSQWLFAAVSPHPDDLPELIVHYSFMPRLFASMLCGAALALAGVLFQQVMRNPIAEPTTLGVSAGAGLALKVATVFVPGLLTVGYEFVALLGAAVATFIVFGLASNRGFSPLSLILGGLVVNFVAGAFSSVLTLFYTPYLESIFLWSAGSLHQNDWSAVTYLLPRFLSVWGVCILLVRPLTVLALEDEGARSLGLSLFQIRVAGLGLAVCLSAFVVSAVGMIAFIGLAAPAIVRLMGARRLGEQMFWAPLLGATLLWMTDQTVQFLAGGDRELIPTGAAAAMLGAPMLMWMLPRLRGSVMPPKANHADLVRRLVRPSNMILALIAVLSVTMFAGLYFGRVPYGWHWSTNSELLEIIDLRAPRMVGSLAGGVMLAIAGTVMQRLTGNPLASPEVLGITTGSMLGAIVCMLLIGSIPNRGLQIVSGAIGAFIILASMLALSRKTNFSPERMLLAGIAVGTVFSTILTALLVSGDPRMRVILVWMSGSTFRLQLHEVVICVVLAMSALAVLPIARRWLEILPLGETMPREVGVNLATSRFWLLMIVSILSAASALVIGPMSFVGLMAPHIARMIGFHRSLSQLAAAAVIGGLIMVAADWIGRNALYPNQLPAGMVASLLGGPFLMYRLFKGR